MKMLRIAVAEAIGTAVLVIGGPGAAVFATGTFGPTIGILGVSLAFGLALLIMAYAIGPVSGCHINPAVTIGMWIGGAIRGALVPVYVVAQLIGATLGALVIWAVASGAPGGFDPNDSNFAVNGWDKLSPGGFGFGAMVIVELVLTALLVFVVVSTTSRRFSVGQAGITIGLTLALIHLVSIPIDNTSVNPARSFGMAVIAGGDALTQLWAFFVFPIAGGVLGVLAWWAVRDRELDVEPTAIDLRQAADLVDADAEADADVSSTTIIVENQS
jgi:aquaporin Z